jgi:hypothetical protein
MFSEEAMKRYKKIPNYVWVIFFIVSIFLANAVEYFAQTGTMAMEIIKAYEAANIPVKYSGIVATIVILSTLFTALIFEFLASILANSLVRRFNLKVDSKDLVFMVRLALIITNVFFGLISLISFASVDAFDIVKATLTVPIITLVFIWLYSKVRERIVPMHFQAKFFSYVAKFYFAINIVISGYYFIANLFVYDVVLSAIDIAIVSVQLGTALIMAAVAYFYAIKLKKVETAIEIKKNDDDPFQFTIIEEEKKDDTIFKDFDI